MSLLYGLVTGIVFGMLLQRAEVIRYDRQIGALRLADMTIVKFMLSTVLVGMVGIYLLYGMGAVKLDIKPTVLGGNILGGLVFGIGWGMVGYCPGTSAGALGEGRWDALWAILGMLVGAAMYAEAYPSLKATVLTWGKFGEVTLPMLLGINTWFLIALFIAGGVALFRWFERRGL